MPQKSFSTAAIVLKRKNIGETDRLVTVLTEKKGRLMAIAKGVRKINSSKRAYLEPGNLVKAFFIKTKSLPLLTQAELISDSAKLRKNLNKIRQLSQLLEIFDQLFVEEEIETNLFEKSLKLRELLLAEQFSIQDFKNNLSGLIVQLGYQDPQETKYKSILDYVSMITERKCKSFDYLTVL
ncbi:MAG: DNA repair protein RecO [Candidatus Woesebacteria bacterium]|jgi:DNA repair protein RecO (recombination protein O)